MNRYSGAFGQPCPLQKDWRWLLSVGVCCYLAILGLRLSLWTMWDNPLLRVGDEFIMSTHDSYLWLAHARVAEFGDGRSLAYFTRLLHEYLGLALGAIGFWGPAFLSSLLAIPCVLWGWALGGREGAVFAGIAGCLTPGFYARTKLGYYDTDMFTLLLPMLVAFWLAWWLRQRTSFRWQETREEIQPSQRLPLQVLGIGLFTRFAGWWHQDIANYSVLLSLLAIVVGTIFARKNHRSHFAYEGAIFILAAIPATVWDYSLAPLLHAAGMTPYILISILLAATLAVWRVQGRHGDTETPVDKYLSLGLLLAALILAGIFSGPLMGIWTKLLLYLKPAATQATTTAQQTAPIFPRVTQSIIEAKLLPLGTALERSAYYYWVGLAALAAMIPVLIARPLSVLLLPLVALSILSIKMGTRFSMFGGAALMIFLSVAGTALSRKLLPSMIDRGREIVIAAVMAALACCLVLPKYREYRSLPPTPVVDKVHAEALMGLGKRAPKDASVWTWWDWGYATQYYAGLKTPIDGGKHSGMDLYPTAVALATDSPRQANQLIRYCTRFPGQDPTREWAKKSGADVQRTIDQLAASGPAFKPAPKQYLAVSYKDLRIAKWLMFYGNWNVTSGTTHEAVVRRFGPGQMAVNLQIGAVMNRGGMKNAILTADMLDIDKADHFDYPQNRYSPTLVPQTPHLVFNTVAGETNFFDKDTYNSMLVQLFTGDPESESIKPYFRLVADGLPFIRIYEVVQN
ncbi:STT3 domain-containing protein [Salidesulfovibrio onnuriiensis]|uniref:STT3 domain-containing protein n=1 Tax=Salidesulfovibrio onnuriiensis TaxID=2583823 RepID=UPI00164FABCB|nr:STT3 domain-containing protein [Salidesulfovibrio onnuriiensis]